MPGTHTVVDRWAQATEGGHLSESRAAVLGGSLPAGGRRVPLLRCRVSSSLVARKRFCLEQASSNYSG